MVGPLTRRLAPALCVALLVAGCTSSKVGGNDLVQRLVPDITISPGFAEAGVRPDSRVRVETDAGTLAEVRVNDSRGRVLKGRFSDGRTQWTSRERLRVGSWYFVSADAVSGDAQISAQSRFRTLEAKNRLAARIAPLEGETVGIGMPIAVYFTAPVRKRAAVERRFEVSDEHDVTGAWHWYSDTEMHYRPKTYWPENDRITLDYDLRGLDAGGGVWGDDARTIRFRTGESHVSRVDARSHTMKVYDSGKLVKSIGVSTGRDEFPTSSGIHVVLEKAAVKTMDSSTIGIPRDGPGGYYLTVPWSVRISYSGEFVHAASWSVEDQGQRNVSHGCVNLSPADGEWFYNFSRRGDIVDVVGTPKKLQQGNGYADWNLSWRQWLAGSALA